MVEEANVGEEVLRMEFQLEQVDEEESPETSTPVKKIIYNPCIKKETKTPGKKPFYYIQKFRREWLDDEEFQPWLEEVEDDVSKGHCSWCQRDLHARLHEIKRHMNTKKHKLIAEQLKSGLNYKKKVTSYQSNDIEQIGGGGRGRKQAHIISILRDLSAVEDNSDPAESSNQMMYEEKENEESIDVADMSDLLKEQVERNNLLNAFISVQKERLELEQEFLDASRRSLSIQEGMLQVLNEKLTG